MTIKFPRRARILVSVALAVPLAACIPAVDSPQAPPPTSAPAPAPTPAATTPPPAPAYENWMDAPQTRGTWSYASRPPYSYAIFGASEQASAFVMRCDRGGRLIALGRISNQTVQQPMHIRTETASRRLSAAPRRDVVGAQLAAELPAADVLLDAMAISKGRFAVETGGEATLYLPSWPEVTRVIEDCR